MADEPIKLIPDEPLPELNTILPAATIQWTKPKPGDTVLTIYGEDNKKLVEIDNLGKMVFGEGYQPDEAAKIFWNAVQYHVPGPMQLAYAEHNDKTVAAAARAIAGYFHANPLNPNLAGWELDNWLTGIGAVELAKVALKAAALPDTKTDQVSVSDKSG